METIVKKGCREGKTCLWPVSHFCNT